MKWRKLLPVLLMIGMCLIACSKQDPNYTISYCSADKEPVWIEKVKYDNYPIKSGGMVLGNWQVAAGLIALFPPPPVPKKIYIYWFNYRQQVFYEATVPLQPNAADIMENLPTPDISRPVLTTGVLPDGSAVVWVSNSLSADYGSWIEVGRAKGRLAEGDVNNYRLQTEDMRQRGEI